METISLHPLPSPNDTNAVDADHDSDSDDDAFTISKPACNTDQESEQRDCIRDVLEAILSIPAVTVSFNEHVRSRTALISDVLKTHLPSTNDLHLLSLLYMCIDLLLHNQSEIGLFCFNRITHLCLSYDHGFNLRTNANDDAIGVDAIRKRSLRLLTQMVRTHGSHLLPLIANPIGDHLRSDNVWLRSGAVLQIAKLCACDSPDNADNGDNHREFWKHAVLHLITDCSDAANMDVFVLQNALHAWTEMAHSNGYASMLDYAQIASSKTQMAIIDKCLRILDAGNPNKQGTSCFAVDAILDALSTQLLTPRLSVTQIKHVAQHMMAFIDLHFTVPEKVAFVVNVMSAVKVLLKCLQMQLQKEEKVPGQFLDCVSFALLDIARVCGVSGRPELQWSLLTDCQLVIAAYPQICRRWSAPDIIACFGLVYHDANFIKQCKLRLLCTIITGVYTTAMQTCELILVAMEEYLVDCVDLEIVEHILQNIERSIRVLLETQDAENAGAKFAVINRLVGVIASNLWRMTAEQTDAGSGGKYVQCVPVFQRVLMALTLHTQHCQQQDLSEFQFLRVEYHRNLVHRLLAFFLRQPQPCGDVRVVNTIVYLTGEYCAYLSNQQIFAVFNAMLPSFVHEPSTIQLSMLTAVTKIYLKINAPSKCKIQPLLQHIFALCRDHPDVNVDVRCRAIMYQRLLNCGVEVAKKVVLGRPHLTPAAASHSIENVGVHLCRVSALYDCMPASQFVDTAHYVAVADEDDEEDDDDDDDDENSDEDDTHDGDDDNGDDAETPITSDDDDDDDDGFVLLVDKQSGEGLTIYMQTQRAECHKIWLRLHNQTAHDIYQIDLKLNKNYLAVQVLKTLLSSGEILKRGECKTVVVPLKLTEKTHDNIAMNVQSKHMQAAIRYFQQTPSSHESDNFLSRQSNVVFFNCQVSPHIFFNEFKDETANGNYEDKINGLKAVSRKCQLQMTLHVQTKQQENCEVEHVIEQCLMQQLKCRKIKRCVQGHECKNIYMALLQFKWVLIGVCVHGVVVNKGASEQAPVAVDIITKSHAYWHSEVALQSAKFTVLANDCLTVTILDAA